MSIKQLKFKVGDVVKTPRGAVGTITHIGAERIPESGLPGVRIISIEYRVLRSYWAEWQLRKIKPKEANDGTGR